MRITRRKDGRYCTTIVRDGQRQYIYGNSRQEIYDKLFAPQKSTNGETLEQFIGVWLEQTRPGWEPKTYESYEEMSRLHIIPHLGSIGLQAMSYEDVQRLILIRKHNAPSTKSCRGGLRNPGL